MLCFRCLRGLSKPQTTQFLLKPATTIPRTPAAQRPFSLLSPHRPLLFASPSQPACPPAALAAPATSPLADVLPKVTTHPALAGIQVRNGPRDTYDPSHRVRKRRHGFLSRLRTRTGRATLRRRRAKGRTTMSH
ncbi:ribosomal protein L34-domain-containing protein [Cryomyces antarcticus]